MAVAVFGVVDHLGVSAQDLDAVLLERQRQVVGNLSSK